jgi:WD40 repeat protein
VRPLALGRAQLLQTWKHAGEAVAFSRDGERIVTSDWRRGLTLRETSSDRVLKTRGEDIGRAAGLAFSRDESHVVHLNREGQLLIWKIHDNRTRGLRLGGAHPRSHVLSLDGRFTAQSADRSIALFDVIAEKKEIRPTRDISGDGKAWCLAITPDGARLAAGYWDGTTRIYDTATQAVLFNHRLAHTPTVVALTADAQQIAVFSQKDGLLLLSTATGEARQLWPAGHDLVRCLRFSDDGTRLLAGMKDNTARMWSVDDARPLLVIDVEQDVQDIAWCEQQQLLATASGTVKLWKCDLSPAVATANDERHP